MPTVPAFYSANESTRPAATRVYHNNSACPMAKQIAEPERKTGTNAYRLCEDCERINGEAARRR